MCGIAGIIGAPLSADQYTDRLHRMGNMLSHRGPDDKGIWFDIQAGIGLAHRRLSIIDLSAEGHQPMTSHCGRYTFVFNGEIYNFREIRKTLEPNRIPWRGNSDTEVMLAALDAWGIETSVSRFIGMFAFAVWDRQARVLTLGRDRLGIKPLYFAKIGKGLLFASEVKSILQYPDFQPHIDRDALSLFFRHNCIPAPYAIFQDTWKLEPGTLLTVAPERLDKDAWSPEPAAYWSAGEVVRQGQRRPLAVHFSDAAGQLDAILRDAVRLRMISDVPLGAFLSGGIDSSVLVALMQAQSDRKVKTFSIGFHEMGYDEAVHARDVAAHLGTDHTELYVTGQDALDVIPDLPVLYDEPFSDSSQIPTFLLSRLTRRHVTVCLSGDGGDELFGGYNRHVLWESIWKRMQPVPAAVRQVIARAIHAVSPLTWDKLYYCLSRGLPEKYRLDTPGDRLTKLAEAISAQSPEGMYRSFVSHWKDPGNLVRGSREPVTKITGSDSQLVMRDFTHRMMYLDLITYLPDDILTKVDRASMAVGLEARVPFLDHRVVAFAWRLPLEMKVHNRVGKRILREVLYRYVPRELVERPKTGFAIPLDTWLRGPLRDWAEDLLSPQRLRDEGILHAEKVGEKWSEHLSGTRNRQHELWDVLMFQAWKRHYRL